MQMAGPAGLRTRNNSKPPGEEDIVIMTKRITMGK
jgi:hypothetical protein